MKQGGDYQLVNCSFRCKCVYLCKTDVLGNCRVTKDPDEVKWLCSTSGKCKRKCFTNHPVRTLTLPVTLLLLNCNNFVQVNDGGC